MVSLFYIIGNSDFCWNFLLYKKEKAAIKQLSQNKEVMIYRNSGIALRKDI